MPYAEASALRWFEFDIFKGEPGISHGVFTRQGGVSPEPWSSLNMATSVGDDRSRVIENRRRILEALPGRMGGFYDVWQVHGTDVLLADRPRMLDEPHKKADSIITNRDNLAVLMLFADCVPILFFDPVKRAVGMAHAGWQGTVNRVAGATVQAMVDSFQSDPADLLVGIGPSICPEHYQVGLDVIEKVEKTFGANSGLLTHRMDSKAQLDLWQANVQTLVDSGVQEDHIQVAGICTVEHPVDWYSHRGEKGKTGRFASVIALTE